MRALVLAAAALCACQGAGRLRYDVTDSPGRGWFVEPPVRAVAWRSAPRSDLAALERWLSGGRPVFVRLDGRRPRLALVLGRDREQGLWVLRQAGGERVVSDAWLLKRWGGWAAAAERGRLPVVTKQ